MRLCVSLFRGVAAPLGCVVFIRMLIALLGGPVANFPALWYDKFNKLESSCTEQIMLAENLYHFSKQKLCKKFVRLSSICL